LLPAPVPFCALRGEALAADRHLGKNPLAGRRVVVTRAPEQAQDFVRRLEQLGAEVILFPTVAFSDPTDTEALDSAIRALEQFDWVLFSSANAVRFFSKRCRALALVCGTLQSPRPMVAAVGPVTAEAATEEGFRVDYVAEQHSGHGLAGELWGALTDRRILLPRSNRAGAAFPRMLREIAAEVVDPVAYCTGIPASSEGKVLERIRRGDVDVLAFASPSAVQHFAEAVGAEGLETLDRRARFAAIGPATAAAIREAGLRVDIEPAEATSSALAEAIADHFASRPPGAKTP
jgi:uroporphyrinogen III methyltransferase/synthase